MLFAFYCHIRLFLRAMDGAQSWNFILRAALLRRPNIRLSLEAFWRGLCVRERSEQHKP